MRALYIDASVLGIWAYLVVDEAENTIGNLAWLCYAKFQIRIGQVGLYVYVQCIIKRPFLDKFKSGRIVSVCVCVWC